MSLPPDLTAILLSAASDGISREHTPEEPLQQILTAINRCVLGRTLTIRVGAFDPLRVNARGRKLLHIHTAPPSFAAQDLIGQALDESPDVCGALINGLKEMCEGAADVAISQAPFESAHNVAQAGVSAQSLIALLPVAPEARSPEIQIAALRSHGASWQTASELSSNLSAAMAAADDLLPKATWLAPDEVLVTEAEDAHAILLFDQGRSAAILRADGETPTTAPAKSIMASLAAILPS